MSALYLANDFGPRYICRAKDAHSIAFFAVEGIFRNVYRVNMPAQREVITSVPSGKPLQANLLSSPREADCICKTFNFCRMVVITLSGDGGGGGGSAETPPSHLLNAQSCNLWCTECLRSITFVNQASQESHAACNRDDNGATSTACHLCRYSPASSQHVLTKRPNPHSHAQNCTSPTIAHCFAPWHACLAQNTVGLPTLPATKCHLLQT